MGDAVTIEELRTIPTFDGLPDSLMEWFAANGTVLTFRQGELLFEPGAPADKMIVVLQGRFSLQLQVGGQLIAAYTIEPGEITGMLPYSRMTSFMGRAIASTDVKLFTVRVELFDEMLRHSQELGRRLVGLMSDRVREGARHAEQREKMVALGTLAAGLAHELNNPAAAVRGAADALGVRVRSLGPLTARLLIDGLTPAHFEALLAARDRLLADRAPRHLSTLERGEAEDSVGTWLEERGVGEAWVRAETFVDMGFDGSDLEVLAATVPEATVADALNWLEASLAAERLAHDVTSASTRISDLVGAVKLYSHMDRSQDKELTDLPPGLDSTLVMLTHKIKKKNAQITRRYEPGLPRVPVYPGQINQVWTNLLDNALDAIQDGGHVSVAIAREMDHVVVSVTDDGHGIPEEVQGRIFEPFFTTKSVGQGTGLGLDIVDRIVTQHHGGHVGVTSRPGETVFEVRLPVAS